MISRFSITPAGTATEPHLGYAGTSGHSGSDTSEERARREDSDGTTAERQKNTLTLLAARGTHGMTWRELAGVEGWHHGQASGALSNLHKAELICRLTERRDKCLVYVLPAYVEGRPTTRQGNARRALTDEDRWLIGRVEAARSQDSASSTFYTPRISLSGADVRGLLDLIERLSS